MVLILDAIINKILNKPLVIYQYNEKKNRFS